MSKYISREDALWIASLTNASEETKERLQNWKAADVQPVVHAYWTELPKALNPNENPCKCSNCGHILSFMNYYPKSKYCPNCGALMDLKDGGTVSEA